MAERKVVDVHKYHSKWESGGIVLHSLNFSTWWRWVVNFTPWSLYTRYPSDKELDRPESWPGYYGME